MGLWAKYLLPRFLVILSLCFSHSVSATTGSSSSSLTDFFPQASGVGDYSGDPPSAPVYQAGETIGYLLHTIDIAPIPAYSGKPMDMLVGIDLQGVIRGVKVIEHHEPILLVGIPESTLEEFGRQYVGRRVDEHIRVGGSGGEGGSDIDAVSGATVTVIVMNRAIMRAAQQVAISRGIIPDPALTGNAVPQLRSDYYEKRSWQQLVESGAVQRLLLSRGEVDKSFAGTPAQGRDEAPASEKGSPFIDLYFAYLNAQTTGRNLLGEEEYQWLISELNEGEHAIVVLADGLYSYRGSGFVRGGIFDRILVHQGEREIAFRDLDYHRLGDLYAEGMPPLAERSIFIIREDYAFKAGLPWELELLIKRQTTPLESVFSRFSKQYRLPVEYTYKQSSVEGDEAIWRGVWHDKRFQIVVLVSGLLLLTVIIVLQDLLVHYPRLLSALRNGFLLYTLLFIGWYMLGQISIVNVFTFTAAVMNGFQWETFLIDPIMFILWSFVAASLLMWGRGVYCGWLCPFGALQKLVNEVALKLKVPQLLLPQFIHDRLWGIKYLILMVLFAISLDSLATAERYAEIEPFKTAITLRFNRDLPFALYALLLVVISAFNCKFFCKYLCPLGAALAVPTRLSLVNWLRRRKECGNPCQTCAVECEIQAISSRGDIQLNECHFCLDCQVTYYDERKCPPLVREAKKRQQATMMEADH
ncbi:MAG: 4Fe-4S binding protein [Chromatiales bacterium]|nr:4Fe-4S binding protein [Chromatiales bacterium]